MSKKKNLVTLLVVFGILALAGIVIYLNLRNANLELVPKEIAQCIGQNAHMYSQTGCHFCKEQKDLFGSSVQYLAITECDYEPSVCNTLGIQGTPTWIIKNQSYVGVQSIEKLRELTGC